MECFRTSAYSTAGDGVELVESSIKSMERLRRSGGSTFGLFDETAAVGVACFIGLVLLIDDREEWRGLTSGGIDDDICRIGGLGGGDDSGDIAESSDFEMYRLRGDSFAGGCCMLDATDVLFLKYDEKQRYLYQLVRSFRNS